MKRGQSNFPVKRTRDSRGRLRGRGKKIGAKEARLRALRLIKRNDKLFRRLA